MSPYNPSIPDPFHEIPDRFYELADQQLPGANAEERYERADALYRQYCEDQKREEER